MFSPEISLGVITFTHSLHTSVLEERKCLYVKNSFYYSFFFFNVFKLLRLQKS